ncbi:MAG TPA: carbohydrate ABC transporter permease [Chloroflexota bacterium]|nr:carbohydrate ABC transporter permease [Chloroflexota bacterium]
MSTDLAALRPARLMGGAVRYGVVGFATVVVGYPVLWMLLQSFKTKFELYSNIWGLPQQLFVDNYVQAWRIARMGTYILNSVIVSVGTVAVVLVVASLAGYAFAKLRFPGRDVLFYTFVFTLIVPVQVTIIPLYAVVSGLGLSNTYFALILPYAAAGLPLSIFLLRAFFASVPREIEEAARIDGCSELAAFWRVVLPISGPGLATVTILQFLGAWNEFLLALIFIRNPALRTIPLGLQAFFFEYSVEWGYLFAALAMATVPVIVVYVVMQRQFIKGLTAGAVTG